MWPKSQLDQIQRDQQEIHLLLRTLLTALAAQGLKLPPWPRATRQGESPRVPLTDAAVTVMTRERQQQLQQDQAQARLTARMQPAPPPVPSSSPPPIPTLGRRVPVSDAPPSEPA